MREWAANTFHEKSSSVFWVKLIGKAKKAHQNYPKDTKAQKQAIVRNGLNDCFSLWLRASVVNEKRLNLLAQAQAFQERSITLHIVLL
jgi:hypothetical protein